MSGSQRSAAAVVAALAGAGTRLLFGVPGGGPNLDVVGAAAGAGLEFILAHGETAAAIMAATGADLTGAPGAVLVTRGPGLASAANGIAHATLDRLPVVVIADTVPAREAGRIRHQRLDQAALGHSVGKAAITLGAHDADRAAAFAVRLALTAPAGPVVINMDPGGGASAGGDLCSGSPAAADGDLAPLATALGAARRPVVLLGTGARAHTRAVRAALAGSSIPVLHTYRARGIMPDSSGEAAGLVTGGTMEWPLLAAADLIVGLGVDPAEMIPAAWDYAAPTVMVTETGEEQSGAAGASEPGSPGGQGGQGGQGGMDAVACYFTGAAELTAPLPAALSLLAAHRGRNQWPAAAGPGGKADILGRLRGAAPAAPGLLSPQERGAPLPADTPHATNATAEPAAHVPAAATP